VKLMSEPRERGTGGAAAQALLGAAGPLADRAARAAQVEVVNGAGHFTWKDAPDRYWPLVTDFVTTTTGTKPPELASHPDVAPSS
jgi:hypothetical protein